MIVKLTFACEAAFFSDKSSGFASDLSFNFLYFLSSLYLFATQTVNDTTEKQIMSRLLYHSDEICQQTHRNIVFIKT